MELENWDTSPNKAKKVEAARAEGWGLEISLDIETAHAICQNCNIALVEAKSTSFSDLEAAEGAAADLGATEISNSWGGPECGATMSECVSSTQAFDQPGIVITASAGDDGYLSWTAPNSSERGFASFPASSPDVVAVGGTRLELKRASHTWRSETVWNDGGENEGRTERRTRRGRRRLQRCVRRAALAAERQRLVLGRVWIAPRRRRRVRRCRPLHGPSRALLTPRM